MDDFLLSLPTGPPLLTYEAHKHSLFSSFPVLGNPLVSRARCVEFSRLDGTTTGVEPNRNHIGQTKRNVKRLLGEAEWGLFMGCESCTVPQ